MPAPFFPPQKIGALKNTMDRGRCCSTCRKCTAKVETLRGGNLQLDAMGIDFRGGWGWGWDWCDVFRDSVWESWSVQKRNGVRESWFGGVFFQNNSEIKKKNALMQRCMFKNESLFCTCRFVGWIFVHVRQTGSLKKKCIYIYIRTYIHLHYIHIPRPMYANVIIPHAEWKSCSPLLLQFEKCQHV